MQPPGATAADLKWNVEIGLGEPDHDDDDGGDDGGDDDGGDDGCSCTEWLLFLLIVPRDYFHPWLRCAGRRWEGTVGRKSAYRQLVGQVWTTGIYHLPADNLG